MRQRRSAAVGTGAFFVLAPGVVVGVLPWLLTGWAPEPAGLPLRVLGVTLLAAALSVLVSAFVRFVVEGLGTPAPVAPTQHLVVGGPYRHVRNPMYLAVVAAIVGQSLLLGQWVLLPYAAVVAAAVTLFVYGYEQPTLARTFGAEYDAYRRAVPAWLPRPQPWTPGDDPDLTGHGHHDDGHDDHHSGDDHHAGHDDGHEAHEHGHDHASGRLGWLRELVAPHSHDAAVAMDSELETSQRGMRALLLSFAALLLTALAQLAVFALSGSVALLVDTLHNFADALTALPIAIAFTLGRRAPTRRYTYGFGRAEDLAGIVVVLFIAASAALAGYLAVRRLLDPEPIDHLVLVATAGLIGFLGNELVARYRISVGRSIGSAALVADGLHARTDGFTSLGVVVGAAGAGLGFEAADPIVGLLITVAVLGVLRDAARDVYRRLMDAVDPALVDQVEQVARATVGVLDVGEVRLRWIGHQLRAELEIVVDHHLTLIAAHRIAATTEHRLLHEVARLTAALVHADPLPVQDEHRKGEPQQDEYHELLHHHREAGPGD